MAERKYYDNYYEFGPLAAGFISQAGSFLSISEPMQGVTNTNRIGDKVTGSSIQFVLEIWTPALGTTNPYNTTRCIGFLWMDDTIPVVADILEDATHPTLTTFEFDKKVKRKILWDWSISQFSAPNAAINIRPMKRIVLNMAKMKGGKNIISFNQTGAVNLVYVLLLNDNAGAQNTQWEYRSYTRYTFLDM